MHCPPDGHVLPFTAGEFRNRGIRVDTNPTEAALLKQKVIGDTTLFGAPDEAEPVGDLSSNKNIPRERLLIDIGERADFPVGYANAMGTYNVLIVSREIIFRNLTQLRQRPQTKTLN